MTMKTLISILLCSFFAVGVVFVTHGADKSVKPRKGKLQHVVSFKFKETTTKEQIKEVEDAFRGLKKKIPQIKDYQWGMNVSSEKRDKGFTHCFVLTFKAEKDRDDYIVHPDHKAFGKIVGPVLEDVFVIDFWVED